MPGLVSGLGLLRLLWVFTYSDYMIRTESCGDRYRQKIAVDVVITTFDIVTDVMSILTLVKKLLQC